MTEVNAVIVHRLPGRIRLRLDGKRGDSASFSALAEDFSTLGDVHHVKANARTGSIVIEFAGAQETLLKHLRERGVAVQEPAAEHVPARTSPVESAGAIEMQAFHLVSGRTINSMFMFGAMLAVAGVVQLMRGKIVAPAIPTFWYAMDAFRRARKGG